MTGCNSCQREFPDHLVNELTLGFNGALTTRMLCPMCALKMLNEHHRTSYRGFRGEQAQALLLEAKEYIRECKSKSEMGRSETDS